MKVKIEFLGRTNPEHKESMTVELHALRGNTHVVAQTHTVIENEARTFELKGGQKLVVLAPEGDEEIVYDPKQGAAVRKGSLEPERTSAPSAPQSRPQTQPSQPAAQASASRPQTTQPHTTQTPGKPGTTSTSK